MKTIRNKLVIGLFGVLILGLSSNAHALCGKVSPTGHVVITIEGLMGKLGSRVKKVAKSMQSNGNFGVSGFGWGVSPKGVMKCIAKWQAQSSKPLRITIMGHSWGGHKALKVAREMAKAGMKVNDLVIIDGRGAQGGNHCDKNMRGTAVYPKVPGVGKVTNFYGCNSALNGAKVAGAENNYVDSGHVNMPYHPYVKGKIAKILGGSGAGPNTPNTSVADTQHPDVLRITGNAQRIRQSAKQWRQEQKAKRIYRCQNKFGGGTHICDAAKMREQNIRNYGKGNLSGSSSAVGVE